jgi:hypothetical protein
MKRYIMFLMMAFAVSSAVAHEMTPTYPKLVPSHLQGVVKTTMEIFNKRNDVEYYEIGVFDKDFNPIPFVSSYRVVHLKYLGHLKFDIYIREKDKDRAVYICSRSKLRKGDEVRTAVSSRICSKIK